ncbi:MAG: transposase [Melioribacteraceae bacterium]|nr:transposase [Melioribacteraceae bacterium]
MDESPLNISSFGKALRLEGGKLYRWYRDVLSDYAKDGGESVRENNITFSQGDKEETIEVPIFREENFGSHMAIDEKQIGNDFYTIISNRESGKLAMLAKTMKYFELNLIFDSHPNVASKVETLTRDFSNLYKKVGDQIFSKSIQIGDKFHVIKNLMDAHQSIRIRYRQKELTDKRESYIAFKSEEKERRKECEQSGIIFKKRKFSYKEKRYSNGETKLELLARGRYLLYKYENKWSKKEKKRAEILFGLFPEIETAYKLSCEFRDFMSRKNIGESYLHMSLRLNQWYENVEKADISEMSNFQNMVETNEEYIMNYFINGETNALAEGLNSKIQRFITSNNGTRDKDFFFFRLDNYYA